MLHHPWIEAHSLLVQPMFLQEPDCEAIIKDLLADRALHRFTSEQSGRTTHCWHACFLLCMCCTCNGASSECERIGSVLHSLETGDSAIYATRVANRLRLRVAGFEGISTRDEWMVQEITRSLLDTRTPFVKSSQQRKRKRQNENPVGNPRLTARVAASEAKSSKSSIPAPAVKDSEDGNFASVQLRMMMKDVGSSIHSQRAMHAPVGLDPASQKALQHVLRPNENFSRVVSLPAYVHRGPGATKLLPNSTVRERMSAWLESTEGLAWNQQRQELWKDMYVHRLMRKSLSIQLAATGFMCKVATKLSNEQP